jgi:hypothetical protein
VTVSILQTLAALPSGKQDVALDTDDLARYLRETILTEPEKVRNERHVLRDELYRDGGCGYMEQVIDTVFTDDQVKDLRKKWVKHARFNNAIKRIVNELSTVYSAPAARSVADDASNERYQALLEQSRFDEQMIHVNRMYNLHRTVLVGFRVRELPDGTREPVVDVATPSVVRAILHPIDPTWVVGWLIRIAVKTARRQERPPAWMLWTDHERALLDENMAVIPDSWVPHGFGVCPWVPITRGPTPSGFWPGEEGEDLVAATVSIWFANISMMKETKSSTKQPIVQGDATTMARSQAMDSEVPIEAPDGVAVNTIDLGNDPKMFQSVADHALEKAGNNYGLSSALMSHQGVQSAEARELMRVPIRELRREQQTPFRIFERRFAEVMSKVCAVDLPDHTFKTDGWRIDFGEAQTPMTPTEELTLFEKERAAALDNTVAFLMRRNPDLTVDEALAQIETNIKVELERNRMMRPLAAVNGSTGQTLDDDPKAPEENGADGAKDPTFDGSKPPADGGDNQGDAGLNGRNG